jgi:hypothetical protein
LMTEYQPYGVRHFLRELDAEGASELRRRPVHLKDGSTVPKAGFAPLEAFRPDALAVYRTLVLRRSPVESRPPAAFRLVWSGRFYDVWQKGEGAISAAPLPCAGRAASYPMPTAGPIDIGRAGEYDLWIGGSVRGRLDVVVDGRAVASVEHELSNAGQYVPLGRATLGAGRHSVELRQSAPRLQPGAGGAAMPIGPFALSPVDRCTADAL